MGRAAPVVVSHWNRDVLYVGSERGGGVYKSLDGGDTWTPVNVGLTDTVVYGLAMDPVHSRTLYVSGSSGVFKTITGGE